jgi:tripartite-type tricarboxylate transporter receptor subunit TctC
VITRRSFVAAAGAASAVLATGSRGALAAYPDSPVRMIIPFPGGSGEVVARLVGDTLTKFLGQPVVIEAHAGAAGNVAANFVAKAPADGYTIMMGVSTIFEINPLLYKPEVYTNLEFDPNRDLVPISMVADQQFVLVVNPKVPANSVQELIDYAKKNPGELTAASGGVGSPLYLAGQEFMLRTDTKMLDVAYKGGGADVLAVLGGFADVLFGSVTTLIGNIKAGKVRALGVTGSTRLDLLPDLPTIAEAGVPGYDVVTWHVVCAPAGVPDDIRTQLHVAVVKTIESPAVKQGLEKQGMVPHTSTPEEAKARIAKETADWRTVFEKAHIKQI